MLPHHHLEEAEEDILEAEALGRDGEPVLLQGGQEHLVLVLQHFLTFFLPHPSEKILACMLYNT